MRAINIHQAKTQLSRLVEEAAAGRPFVIAKAGLPRVMVVAYREPSAQGDRTFGFLRGEGVIGADLKADFSHEINAMFAVHQPPSELAPAVVPKRRQKSLKPPSNLARKNTAGTRP